jgi:methylglyoxal synthase
MNIALASHNKKKVLMENLVIAYRHILNKHDLFTTGSTGKIIEEAANLSVHKYLAGNLGGEQQLGAQIAHNDIDLVIYLSDPERKEQYDIDMNIVRLSELHNIPLATNLASAEVMLLALDRGDLNWREIERK